MTSNPATAIRRETSLGSITVGRDADVTILKVIQVWFWRLFISQLLPICERFDYV